ncbi:MFS transporter [Lactobacillus sp. CBA3606]|uniref:MDR family MFS transporter n=1 Tax=Lactobacillus sp. CBA3606 TaxID=2099789 RepID=UPI000CFD0167|nr:MDR family MFS transporter [Lactobacillus sp. CBA3606]AVK63600.1 MFS transporter [Lactobacillus sp. CBA3606]
MQSEKQLISRRYWLFLSLGLVLFMATLDQTITTTALNGIVQELGHLNQSVWVITSFLLTSAVMTLIFGKLGDIFGRKRILQLALGLFMVGSLLSGLSPSMLTLILARGFQGIGAGGLNSLVQAVLADLVPARQRGKYQALFGLISMVALIAGPVLGGYFVQYLTWRWIFFINLPIGIVAMAILGFKLTLPQSQQPKTMAIDYFGGGLATGITTLTLLMVTLGGTTVAWMSPTMLGMLLGDLALIVVYLVVEQRAKASALTPLTLFRNGTFNIASLMFALSTAALFVAMIYVPMVAQQVYRVTTSRAGFDIIPTLVALIIGTMIAGMVIERTGKYKALPIIGALLMLGGFYGLSQLANSWSLMIWQIPVGLGIGIFTQISLLVGQNTVAVQDLGTATGVLNFFKTLGGAFGSAIFGVILTAQLTRPALSHLQAFQTVFGWGLPLAGLLLVLSLFLKAEPLSDEVLAYEE